MSNMELLREAWDTYGKAERLEDKAVLAEQVGKDNLARIARAACEKALDEAVRLEAEAVK